MILKGLELSVNLGWTSGERAKQQSILLDATIDFAIPPLACTTDQLTDTYCYDQLIQQIKATIAVNSFRLLEHVTYEIYQLIKNFIQADTKINIQVTKKPAIANLAGVTFCYSD